MVGPERGRAEPDVPVERRRNRGDLGRRVDALGPDRAVRPAVDLEDIADSAVLDPFADQARALAGVTLVAHLGDDLGLLGGLGQEAGFLDRVGQGLLNVDMLAQLDGGHGDDGVVVVWRRHGDSIDHLFLFQHPAEIAVLGRLVVHRLFVGLETVRPDEPGHALVVDVAEGDDVLGADAARVREAHAADADTGDVDRVARRLFLLGGPDDVAGDDHQAGRGRRRRAEELPAAPERFAGSGGFVVFVHVHLLIRQNFKAVFARKRIPTAGDADSAPEKDGTGRGVFQGAFR